MKIAWDRQSHTWDDEIILRTMMLGDDLSVRELLQSVDRERLQTIYQLKHGTLDRKSQLFWGYILGGTLNKPSFRHIFHDAPSRHITR